MTTKKKPGNIGTYTAQDGALLDASDFSSFGIGYPSEFEEAITTLREWKEGGDPETLEFLLERFEREATAHLAAQGYDTDPAEVWWLRDDDGLTKHDQAAVQVILSARRLRLHIGAGDAVAATLETMRLCFAGVALGLHDFAMTGIRAKQGRKTGGTRKADSSGFREAIKHVLPRLKRPSARTAWDYFRKHHNGAENALELGRHSVFYYDTKLQQTDNENGKTRAVSFETFRSHIF